ncbi:MAG: hypothetical protein ACXVBT_07850 [Flavisolibacter sp.]
MVYPLAILLFIRLFFLEICFSPCDRFRVNKFAKTFQVAQKEPGDNPLIIVFPSGKYENRQVIQISTSPYVKD